MAAQAIVQLADDGHVGGVVAIVNMAYAAAEGDLWEVGAGFERTSVEEVAALIEKRELLVALIEGVVVGSIHCHLATANLPPGYEDAPVAEFGLLAVSERHRRNGVGRQLIASAELWGDQAGCRAVQCELLAPRHGVHQGPLGKDRMRLYYAGLGYTLNEGRTKPFEEVYPALTATFRLARECDALFFEKALPR